MRVSRREILEYGLAVTVGSAVGNACRRKVDRPHVLLITLDTTRADRLGCYGYAGATSPALDRLASRSVVYTRAVATSSWTLPSHGSLFTGKFPKSHGARYDAQGPLRLTDAIEGPAGFMQYRARGLSADEITLAKILKGAGYRTGAVVGGPWMKRVFGLGTGFDYYDDDRIDNVNGRRAEEVTSAALSFIERAAGAPFLLFLNYFDPHSPYAPPSPFEPANEAPEALYDGEIRYMDHHAGRLFTRLDELDLWDRTLVVVTADHGELFGEHDAFGHGNTLYQEELHIPFIVKYPRGEAEQKTTEDFVQLVDVLPIVLERLGIPRPPGVQGGVPPEIGHPIVAEVNPLPFFSEGGDFRAIFHGSYKYVWNSKANHALFNLKDDPRETENLLAQEAGRAGTMERALTRYVDALPPPGAAGPAQAVDEETLKALRSMGYVK